jgi:hypothetical protein
VFGKVIGGGMPLAAFGGTRAIMEQLAPLGPVYQAGTLSGNPVATACGLATLREISASRASSTRWARKTRLLVDGLSAAATPACRSAATARAACSASSCLMSMAEVPHAGEHHRHAALVGGGDDLLVAHRAAGLDHAGRACVDHHVQAVAEREEGVAGHAEPCQRQAGVLRP